jgi:hypothetical protein
MPLKSIVIEESRLVVTRAAGVLKLRDLEENRAALLADPAFDPTYDHLFDLRGVGSIVFPTEDVERATSVRAFSEASRRAVVAPEDLSFGLARMYGAHRGDLSELVRVFRDLDQALRWLERDPESPCLQRIRVPEPKG